VVSQLGEKPLHLTMGAGEHGRPGVLAGRRLIIRASGSSGGSGDSGPLGLRTLGTCSPKPLGIGAAAEVRF
jgi:hypothetical protein